MSQQKTIVLVALLAASIAVGAYLIMNKRSSGGAATDKSLDPQIAHFLDDLAKKDGPPIYALTPEQARKVLNDLQAPTVNTMPAIIEDRMLSAGLEEQVSVRIVRPKDVKGILPAVIYSHGGGWVLGNKETHDLLIRRIANWAKVAVIFVNYTPSPEAQYPVAIEQTYAVAKYAATHGAELGIDTTRLALMGDSVGGLMTAAVTQLAKQRGEPKITYQVLLYPVTDAVFDTPTYQEFADGYWLSRKAMEWFWDNFAPNTADRLKSSASPLRATVEELQGLPPAFIVTDEHDVLRYEGEAYAHKLMQAGVDVAAIRILGTVHDFAILAPLKDTTETVSIIEFAALKLNKALYAK